MNAELELLKQRSHSKFEDALRTNTASKANDAMNNYLMHKDYVAVEGFPEYDENGNFINEDEVSEPASPTRILSKFKLQKECTLTRSLGLSQLCLKKLGEVYLGLQKFSMVKYQQKLDKDSSVSLVELAETMIDLTREAFISAYRLYKTAIGLHVAEDFLRNPKQCEILDFSVGGRIRLPTKRYNQETISHLSDSIRKAYRFKKISESKYPKTKDMQDLFASATLAVEYLHSAATDSNEVFNSMLYCDLEQRHLLQEYLLTLNSVERSDIIMESQDLRRSIDEISICFEKLSWGSYVLFRMVNKLSSQTEPSLPVKRNKIKKLDKKISSSTIKPKSKNSEKVNKTEVAQTVKKDKNDKTDVKHIMSIGKTSLDQRSINQGNILPATVVLVNEVAAKSKTNLEPNKESNLKKIT